MSLLESPELDISQNILRSGLEGSLQLTLVQPLRMSPQVPLHLLTIIITALPSLLLILGTSLGYLLANLHTGISKSTSVEPLQIHKQKCKFTNVK